MDIIKYSFKVKLSNFKIKKKKKVINSRGFQHMNHSTEVTHVTVVCFRKKYYFLSDSKLCNRGSTCFGLHVKTHIQLLTTGHCLTLFIQKNTNKIKYHSTTSEKPASSRVMLYNWCPKFNFYDFMRFLVFLFHCRFPTHVLICPSPTVGNL